MRVVVAGLVVALVLISASLTMRPFQAPAGVGDWRLLVPDGASDKYFEIRDAVVTPKYQLFDYGVTLLIVSIAAAVTLRLWPLHAPKSILGFLLVALLAPLVSAAALTFDFLQGAWRQEYPPWADSLGIPLMGVLPLLLAGTVWSFGQLTLLPGVRRRPQARLSIAALRSGLLYLRVVVILTVLLMAVLAVEGAYWYVLAGGIWLYLYMAIAAARQHDT